MPVPYNTSKVKIGQAYEPPYRWLMSRDEERLQVMLIGPGKSSDTRIDYNILSVVCVVGAVLATVLLIMGG